MPRPTPRKAAGWAAIAVVVVGGFEGLRTVAYRDPVGIPTVCFGETLGVRMGDRYTVEECRAMLADRLVEFDAGIRPCLAQPVPDPTRAAFVSFAYNIGIGGFCKSIVARLWNNGDRVGACDALLRYVYAKGIKLPGLVKRRQQERALCLQGQ